MPGPPQLAPLGAPHPVSKADPATLWRKLIWATCISFLRSLSKAYDGLKHTWTVFAIPLSSLFTTTFRRNACSTADSPPNCLPNSCSIFPSSMNKTRRNSFAWGRGHPPKPEGQSTESWCQNLIQTASHTSLRRSRNKEANRTTSSATSRGVILRFPNWKLSFPVWISQTGSETRGNPGW